MGHGLNMDRTHYRRAARNHFQRLVNGGVLAGAVDRVLLLARPVARKSAGESGRSTGSEPERPRATKAPEPEHPVLEVLRGAKSRVLLVGKPGAGKTTTLQQYALALASADDGPLPLLVPLRELDGGYRDLESLIVQCMGRIASGGALEDLHRGSWVLLLDGVNERSGVDTGDPLARLMENFPAIAMIFTSREPASRYGEEFELSPLTPADRDALIASWIPDLGAALQQRLGADSRLDELSRTPLLLAMLCAAARDGVTPNGTRAALIQASITGHARGYVDKAGDAALDPARINGWLSSLAHTMLLRGSLQCDDLTAEEALRVAPGAPPDPARALRHLINFHLVARSAPGHVEFVHPLIHEFYAARNLRPWRQPGERRAWIREYVNRTIWTEPLRLFAEECDDPETAKWLVDATSEVDTILAARLVGSFPLGLQPALLRRLCRAEDTPGTRLGIAVAVGTSAALDELQQLAQHSDSEVRFQVADRLRLFQGPQAALLNAKLLGDIALTVVNAASDHLSRFPPPIDALLSALKRDDVWTVKYAYALPRLVGALMQSDTAEAGAYACELARKCLRPDSGVFGASHEDPYPVVRAAMFQATNSPAVARALVSLLAELGEERAYELIGVLRDSAELVDLEPALSELGPEHRCRLIESSLSCEERFAISSARLLEAVQTRYRLNGRIYEGEPLFAAAVKRRCAGLVPWLAQLVAADSGDDDWHLDMGAFRPLLALDATAAVAAVTRALDSENDEIRRSAAAMLCATSDAALSEPRARAMAIAARDMEVARYLVGYAAAPLAAEVIERVLDGHPHAACQAVIERFWKRHDMTEFMAELRENQHKRYLAWPKTMPEAQCKAFTRSLLGVHDPALTNRFLSTDLWRAHATIVVPYLEQVIATGGHDEVARALEHLNETAWRPPLPTLVRLLGDGHPGDLLRADGLDPDALFVALRPLLRHEDPNTRLCALSKMCPPPPGYLDEFVSLLDEPEFCHQVANRLVDSRIYAVFPALLERPGLIVAKRPDDPSPLSAVENIHREYVPPPRHWDHFEWSLKDAPPEVWRRCLAILAVRDDPAWDLPFFELFSYAPDFAHHERVLRDIRRAGQYRESALEGLIRSARTEGDMEILDRGYDAPEFPQVDLVRLFIKVAPVAVAPFAFHRLTALVDTVVSPDAKFHNDNLAGWWSSLLGLVGTAEHGTRITELARRTDNIWLSASLFQTAAEIQQRTGIYHPHHTIMPRPWTLLHLSDLHFSATDQPERWRSTLAEDLRRELGVDRVDALVLSGDIVDRGRAQAYAAAEQFLTDLCAEFHIPRERVVLVPGNHDVDRAAAQQAIAQVPRTRSKKPQQYDFEAGGKRYKIADRAAYDRRLAPFADFFARALGRPYALDPREQGDLCIWHDLEVVMLGLSSVSNLDGHRPDHATIDDIALGRALDQLRGDPRIHDGYLKIATFHHPLDSPGNDRLRDANFLDRLAVAGFSLVLHGHVHQANSKLFRYDRSAKDRRIEVVGAGTFGARAVELPTGYPWQYNLLRFDGCRVRVETRRREADNGPWKPYAYWTTGPGKPPQAGYDLDLGRA